MGQVEVWHAVALACNLDPDDLSGSVYLRAHAFGDDPFRICPPIFVERLELANSNAGTSFYVEVTGSSRARALVQLRAFARWAVNVWPDIPSELRGLEERPIAKTEVVDAAQDGEGSPWPSGLVAQVFAKDPDSGKGIKWDLGHWKSNLANPPVWLKAARANTGKRGGSPGKTAATWWPLKVADGLLEQEHLRPFEVARCFEDCKSVPEVAEWLGALHIWVEKRKQEQAARASFGQ